MGDFHFKQGYYESHKNILERFMELTNQIYDLDSREVANLFVQGLVKGSLVQERFLETLPSDLNKMKARDEGIIQVMENRQQIAKSA